MGLAAQCWIELETDRAEASRVERSGAERRREEDISTMQCLTSTLTKLRDCSRTAPSAGAGVAQVRAQVWAQSICVRRDTRAGAEQTRFGAREQRRGSANFARSQLCPSGGA